MDTLARTQPVAAFWLPVLGTIVGLAMLFLPVDDKRAEDLDPAQP